MIPGCVLAIDISFERDVLSVLTTKGCNSSGCHGSPAGQSGFKLSLYGADAAADYAMITSAQNGRRVDRANPANSLLLRKPSFAVAHGGGHLLTPESDEYRTLLGWLEQGARRSAAGPGIVSIALAPREVIARSGERIRFTVTAKLSDGSTADLTRQVTYAVNDEGVVKVAATGEAVAGGRGIVSSALGR
ncbi:MAG: cell surface protein, partial [Acidobacteriota bacterium]